MTRRTARPKRSKDEQSFWDSVFAIELAHMLGNDGDREAIYRAHLAAERASLALTERRRTIDGEAA